jgi:hypothetical protein
MPQTNNTQSLIKTNKRLKRYAELLDNRFVIPGTKIRFGWDVIIGLIPGIGDAISLLLSLLIIVDAIKIKTHKSIIFRMLINVFIEFLVGIVPILGDAFDVYWKANLKNLDLLQLHLTAITAKKSPITIDYPPKKINKMGISDLILFIFVIIVALLAYKISIGAFFNK